MKLLTQRALRVFAVLEDYRAGSDDILDAILPFFEPILAEMTGRMLDTEAFADRVRKAYRWNFTSDIVEELAPRFAERGWIESVASTANDRAFKIVYANPVAAPMAANEIQIGQVLATVVDQFAAFISAISPLTAFSRVPEELSDMLVEWLVSIDAYTEDALRQQAIQTTQTDGHIGLSVTLADASNLTSEERYICARFVKQLFEQKSPFIQDLCKIASVGLLTEVIQDFRKPATQVNKTNLTLYLDGPVALDLLGVSGTAAAANIRPLIATLQEIGATVLVFRVSIDEMRGALEAMLRRPVPQRTGATADAIRRNETSEAFVRQVALDPVAALKTYGINIIDRRLDQFPNEHEHFSASHFESLFSRMKWHIELPPRTHDSTIVTQIMRMRRGAYSRDLFQTRHILITRNGTLAQLARRFCLENDLLPTNTVGPAIHQRQLATAVWLRTGLSDAQQQVPRRHVLAACERVLELKKSVVEQVRLTARTLTPEKAEQLELLLTQDRSVQVLMDKTLGVSQIVSPSNIESLVDAMKTQLVAEIEQQKSIEVAAATRDAASKIRKAHEGRRQAEQRASELEGALLQTDAEDRKAVENLVDRVNRLVRTRRHAKNWLIGGIIFSLGFLPMLTEAVTGAAKLSALALSGLLGAVFGYFQLLDRPMGIAKRLEIWSLRKVEELAIERGLEQKLSRFNVEYRDGVLAIRPTEPIKTDLLDR